MAVDKNLFLYDLAVVAIMKNEAPYVKEWLDYHLAAGVDHFYIYDHESSDNFKEVLNPYINAGIVTYVLFPDNQKQCEAYIDAYKTYRFFCRYMTFIDADEFIFPQNGASIVEVVDEIAEDQPSFNGISINWMMYGSNYQEKADYSKGVLERFTRRAWTHVNKIKTIANPRHIQYLYTPHYMSYFEEFESPRRPEKILVNHYSLKSREEYNKKIEIGSAAYGRDNDETHTSDKFTHEKNNEIIDNSILKYRDARQEIFKPKENQIDYERLINSLIENLAPIFSGGEIPLSFFEGKMETFLTCRALASYLKGNVIDEARGEFVETASLKAILSTMFTTVSFADTKLLLSELPNILQLNNPVVKDILTACLNILPQIKNKISNKIDNAQKFMFWIEFEDYDNLYRLLKVFESYEHK